MLASLQASTGCNRGCVAASVAASVATSVAAGVAPSVVVVVVVDTPGLRDNTDLIAVGRRRKGSKAHLPPEMETDYPCITINQKRLH